MKREQDLQLLIEGIQSKEESAREQAMLSAEKLGPEAIQPLAESMADGRAEVARAAKRALWRIVHAIGAPGGRRKRAAGEALIELLGDDQPREVRREVLWMISELSDASQAAQPVADLLAHAELREDARMVLERLPGADAVAALRAGFTRADEEFKFNLAQSLKKRGVAVPGYPCQKLLPTEAKVRSSSGD